MTIKCRFCDKSLGNADYRATVHTNAYHDVISKIHEKIDHWDKDMIVDIHPRHIGKFVAEELKSLLEK